VPEDYLLKVRLLKTGLWKAVPYYLTHGFSWLSLGSPRGCPHLQAELTVKLEGKADSASSVTMVIRNYHKYLLWLHWRRKQEKIITRMNISRIIWNPYLKTGLSLRDLLGQGACCSIIHSLLAGSGSRKSTIVGRCPACNPSYSGGRDQENRSLKPTPGK
jgi:hypothetical protein